MTTDTKEPGRELAIAKQIAGKLQQMEPEYRSVLPAHISPAAFVRVAQTAIQMNEELQECTPKSLLAACTKLAEIGLLPNGEDAAIVAYNVRVKRRGQEDRWEKQAKAMPMVRGLRDLVRRSGEVKDWKVRLVREGDFFEHLDGDVESLVHRSAYDDEAPITHVYSIAYLENGELSRHVMTIAAVNKIRARSRSKDNGPWVTDYPEMVKKTCLRQHSKALPKAKDDIARERIMGSIRALDEAEDVLQLDRPAPAAMPALSMHESARRRLQEAVETSAFDVEAEEVPPAQARHSNGDDRIDAIGADPTPPPAAEAPKQTRKRRSTAERVAAIHEELNKPKEAPRHDGSPEAAAFSKAVPSATNVEFHPGNGARQAENHPASYDDDRFPGDEADYSDEQDGEDPEELAYRDGWHARAGGKTRMPPRTLSTAAEAKCWLDGWDSYDRAVKLNNAPKTAEASEAMLDQMVGKVFA